MAVEIGMMEYMRTNTGRKWYHQAPRPEDVCIEDIAHGLSKICRFVGQIDGEDVIYSVAEHSVRVSYVDQDVYPLWKLLHDGSEAWYNDLSRLLKYAPGMDAYRRYEKLGLSAVCRAFGLGEEEPPEVKAADKRVCATEKRDLFFKDPLWVGSNDGNGDVLPLPEVIVPWTPREAKTRFLMRYYELTGKRIFYPERDEHEHHKHHTLFNPEFDIYSISN